MAFVSFYALANWNVWGNAFLKRGFFGVNTYAFSKIRALPYELWIDFIGERSPILVHAVKYIVLVLMIYKVPFINYVLLKIKVVMSPLS